MGTLDFLRTTKRQYKSFENHPATAWPIEQQLLYLQALALLMNADDVIADTEIHYLRLLLKPMGLDVLLLDDLCTYARQPDMETVHNFFIAFRRQPQALLFLLDAWMMADQDDVTCEAEKAVIAEMAEQLEVNKKQQQLVADVFMHIKNRDVRAIAAVRKARQMPLEYCRHLLEYHEMDNKAVSVKAP